MGLLEPSIKMADRSTMSAVESIKQVKLKLKNYI